ncbi:MAG TPA: radical SAM family heme chaperone HemW [Ignavibacteriaceae bacterium]|nr:MAG: Oxygen-independent coproporphyrinogen-III oxidase 1 [Ignavibacteria bacterium ADurb.Bin266]OQY74162.1 MAG: coproporphyrinogen III oxidase [Ignavibacteriales bacterium UTCHB2]HQF41342.1 radical SAM family heme chaperone HemW [Ignavibacteriaceae bacterium]HQI39872.1 radical SAM family heme chaperone HemW [Ignavibacteriaceae bacterium]
MSNSAIYIHIPFCDHKCIYCDFYSIITTDNIQSFLSALKKEIIYYSSLYNSDRNISSVFFGGGTPSLMEPDYIAEILNCIEDNFSLDNNAEITLETNPGTVDIKRLKAFKIAGINRISIGIQSFNEDELKFLTRIHDSQTAIKTVEDAAIIGFENISIDLIFNLPNQTKEIWKRNLQTAITLPIKHLSAYSLILEKGTILNKMVLDGKVTIQDEDYDADLYETTIDFLSSKGFIQYEVSNFAKPGYECLHNNAYWHYRDYLGFGPSAHSFIQNKRWWNFSSLKKYISEISQKNHALMNFEILSNDQQHEEYVMLALRSSGLNLQEYNKRFSDEWLTRNYQYLENLQKENYLKLDHSNIKLTSKGYAVCDEILKNIL